MSNRILALALCLPLVAVADNSIDTIAAYNGTWKTETEHFATAYSKAGKESTTLRNDCWRSAGFYACDQFVNGESKALIVFTYDSKNDIFHSYPIPANGDPAGSGKLLIKGNVWTFPWEDTNDGKTVYFQVVNVFTAPDRIEYRQEFSTDKTHWTLTAKGTEQKQK
jgi:hypothetical protein